MRIGERQGANTVERIEQKVGVDLRPQGIEFGLSQRRLRAELADLHLREAFAGGEEMVGQ